MHPDFSTPDQQRYYTELPQPRTGWPDRENAAALRKSLDKAHDNLRKLVRENDKLRAIVLRLHKRQKWQLKIFFFLMGATWTVLGGIIKLLLPYALHALAASK